MTEQEIPKTQIEQLASRYCAGVIDQTELDQLTELLRENKQNRDVFLDAMSLHAMIHEVADSSSEGDLLEGFKEQTGEAPATPLRDQHQGIGPKSDSTLDWKKIASLAVAASVLLAVGFLVATKVSQHKSMNVPTAEISSDHSSGTLDDISPSEVRLVANHIEMPGITESEVQPVAVLLSEMNAKWAGRTSEQVVDGTVGPGTIDLESGCIELVFTSGATMLLEAPAKIDLVSDMTSFLHFGKVRCFVPPSAVGFSIETAQSQFVDQGTNFGLKVDADGKQELHVFEGELDVVESTQDRQIRRVVSGSTITQEAGDAWKDGPLAIANGFRDRESIEKHTRELEIDRYAQWVSFQKRFRAREDLVLLYDFEPDASQPNLLIDRTGNGTDGAMVGCKWTSGRWREKRAIEFKRPIDRVKFNLPGTFDNLTMTTWLRLDGFDRFFNSIMLTDRFEDGEIHWQVQSNGSLDLGIMPPGDKSILDESILNYSEPVLGYEDLGRWVHLAVVVDGENGTVTHYRDSKPLEKWERFPDRASLFDVADSERSYDFRVGRAELGNWSPIKEHDVPMVRNLNGVIDEFAIFNRALSLQEIEELYQAGSPN